MWRQNNILGSDSSINTPYWHNSNEQAIITNEKMQDLWASPHLWGGPVSAWLDTLKHPENLCIYMYSLVYTHCVCKLRGPPQQVLILWEHPLWLSDTHLRPCYRMSKGRDLGARTEDGLCICICSFFILACLYSLIWSSGTVVELLWLFHKRK